MEGYPESTFSLGVDMSVNNRRFAAATRTAAQHGGSRGRLKLTLTWLAVAAALSLFTTTLVGNAFASSKPDYAEAARHLPPNDPKIVIDAGKKEVCSVTRSQLSILQAHYETGWMSVTSHGTTVELVTVTGADDHDLRTLLGYVHCRLVKERHVFYLPFDAQTS
jgi:hypothetical protein